MSVLCDSQIKALALNGMVTPFDEAMVNPASLDLKTGRTFRQEIQRRYIPRWAGKLAPLFQRLGFVRYDPFLPLWGEPQPIRNGILLHKGESVLLDTIEYVRIPNHLMAEMWLKSSAGREGGDIYKAGYIDCGFEGTLTFRYRNDMRRPILIVPEMRLCQLVLREMSKVPDKPYGVTGRYMKQRGPTVARLRTDSHLNGTAQVRQ